MLKSSSAMRPGDEESRLAGVSGTLHRTIRTERPRDWQEPCTGLAGGWRRQWEQGAWHLGSRVQRLEMFPVAIEAAEIAVDGGGWLTPPAPIR